MSQQTEESKLQIKGIKAKKPGSKEQTQYTKTRKYKY
jgi:hypothetical protein